MDEHLSIVGNTVNNLQIIDCVDSDDLIYECGCIKCESVLYMPYNAITNKKSTTCVVCGKYYLNIEESKDIYDLYHLDNVDVVDIAKTYNCSKPSIYTAIKRIEYTTYL